MDRLARYHQVVTRNPLFSGMTEAEVEKAVTLLRGRIADYKKGEFLHRQGTPVTSCGLVLSGLLEVCADDFDGNRIIMAEVSPGVTFGESLSFLRVEDSPVYIAATEDAEVLWLSVADLYEREDDPMLPALQKRFTSLLASRTLTMNNRIQILSRISIREKLMVYFSELASRTGSSTFLVPFDREDMATYIGCDRASLSRALSKLKKEGVIDYQKNAFKLLKNGDR